VAPLAPKLLVFTRESPLATEAGDGRYLFDMLEFLASQGVRIEVIWSKPKMRFRQLGFLLLPKESTCLNISIPSAIALGRLRFLPKQWMNKLFPPRVTASESPFGTWMSAPDRAECDIARQRMQKFQPDVCIAAYPWMTPVFKNTGSDFKKPLIATLVHAVWHETAASLAQCLGTGEFKSFSRDMEIALLEQSDCIIAINDDDAEKFKEMLPSKITLTVAPSLLSRASVTAAQYVPGRCLFVGGVSIHNVRGLEWFLSEIWPCVLSALPTATLIVCGHVCDAFVGRQFQHVSFVGQQKRLDAFYEQAQVVVCPLLHGGGTKIKVLEALAFAKPCVTTSVGLQGLNSVSDCVVRADDAGDFAAAVLRLLTEPECASELKTRSGAALQQFAPEQCYGEFSKLIHQAANHLSLKQF
jgi:glycosyltransferase involved in cell wall biosynthesis